MRKTWLYAISSAFSSGASRIQEATSIPGLLQFSWATAIDVDHLAGEEAGFVRGEEQHDVGDILCLARALQDLYHVEHVFEPVNALVVGRAGREDLPWANAVGPNVVLTAHARHVSGEGVYAGLGRVVRSPGRPAPASSSMFLLNPTDAASDDMLTIAPPPAAMRWGHTALDM